MDRECRVTDPSSARSLWYAVHFGARPQKRTPVEQRRQPEAVLEINVKPGWKAGTKVMFSGEGDEIGNSGQAQDGHSPRALF